MLYLDVFGFSLTLMPGDRMYLKMSSWELINTT